MSERRGELAPSWRLIIGVWTVVGLVAALQAWLGFSSARVRVVPSLSDWTGPVMEFFRWLAWVPLTPLAFTLARRVPLSRERLAIPLLVHIGAAFGCAALVESAWYATSTVVRLRFAQHTLPGGVALLLFRPIVLGRLVGSAFTYAAIVGVALALEYQRRLRDRELADARITASLLTAQNKALKMQLQPHFLFNALHAVTALIREDPAQAVRTVAQLGDLLRITLSRAEHAESRLDEELELVRLYFAIEQTRFRDRLTVRFDIADECLSAMLPDLSLQPLAENAIRHGVSRTTGPATISVRARREEGWLVIQVIDDGDGLRDAPSDGIGLGSVRRRLDLLYGSQQELSLAAAGVGQRQGCRVVMRVPFHRAEADRPESSFRQAPRFAGASE